MSVADTPLILVLLPVYNGEQFLHEQIDSILAQTHSHLRLVCRDDGSSDASAQILAYYQRMYPQRVQLLQDNKGNLGASGSFSELMQWALETLIRDNDNACYVALADQDDSWHAEKLQRCLHAMQRAEGEFPGLPILVHSDLRVVDADGGEIAPSLMRYQGLDASRTTFSSQLISNTVTGCTTLINPALLKKALPIPPQAVMHDWWLSLVASAFGALLYIDQPLIEYRQHGRNTVGAREHRPASFDLQTLAKLFQRRQSAQAQTLFEQAAAQAEAFQARFSDGIQEHDQQVIRDVIRLPQMSLWGQRLLFRRLRAQL